MDEELVKEQVEAARETFTKDGLGFSDEGLTEDATEKLKTATVMQWLQQNAKITVLPWKGDGDSSMAAATAASAQQQQQPVASGSS